MPKCEVRILTPAWNDLDRISEFHLRAVGPNSAEKITDKILDTIALLGDNPLLGALHPDTVLAQNNYRKILCDNYVCVYRMIGQTVYVYRIVHGATPYPKLFY